MRSKEAFAYSRSTGYFCSVAALPTTDNKKKPPAARPGAESGIKPNDAWAYGSKKLNLLAVAVFFWGWRDCKEEGDDRVSHADADRHDDVSRNGSSEFGGNAGSAETLVLAVSSLRSAAFGCPTTSD
jgi:hypothetical protein